MSDVWSMFDEDADHAEGTYAAYARSTARYGRRHHDTDRWTRHTPLTQDRD
jgi:hypothetical protein